MIGLEGSSPGQCVKVAEVSLRFEPVCKGKRDAVDRLGVALIAAEGLRAHVPIIQSYTLPGGRICSSDT
jgi:hypothetical protein